MLSPACVISYQPYYLEAARYARGNKTANLLNNQTKSGKESIDCFGITQICIHRKRIHNWRINVKNTPRTICH